MNQTATKIREIQNLFDSPEKWTKGHSARNSNEAYVYPTDSSAVCWCLIGAMEKVDGFDETFRVITKLVQEAGYLAIPKFNDSRLTTFNDVQKVLAEALKISEKEDNVEGANSGNL